MVRLVAKGDNEYVTLHRSPYEVAASDSQVILASFRAVVEGLLAQAVTDGKSPAIRSALMFNYVMLKKLYDEIALDVEQIGSLFYLTEKKLKELEG